MASKDVFKCDSMNCESEPRVEDSEERHGKKFRKTQKCLGTSSAKRLDELALVVTSGRTWQNLAQNASQVPCVTRLLPMPESGKIIELN